MATLSAHVWYNVFTELAIFPAISKTCRLQLTSEDKVATPSQTTRLTWMHMEGGESPFMLTDSCYTHQCPVLLFVHSRVYQNSALSTKKRQHDRSLGATGTRRIERLAFYTRFAPFLSCLHISNAHLRRNAYSIAIVASVECMSAVPRAS